MSAPDPTAELARWLRTIYIANRPLFGDTGGNPAGWELIAAEVVAEGWRPVKVNDGGHHVSPEELAEQVDALDDETRAVMALLLERNRAIMDALADS